MLVNEYHGKIIELKWLILPKTKSVKLKEDVLDIALKNKLINSKHNIKVVIENLTHIDNENIKIDATLIESNMIVTKEVKS